MVVFYRTLQEVTIRLWLLVLALRYLSVRLVVYSSVSNCPFYAHELYSVVFSDYTDLMFSLLLVFFQLSSMSCVPLAVSMRERERQTDRQRQREGGKGRGGKRQRHRNRDIEREPEK